MMRSTIDGGDTGSMQDMSKIIILGTVGGKPKDFSAFLNELMDNVIEHS